jgi:hypothetical protein
VGEIPAVRASVDCGCVELSGVDATSPAQTAVANQPDIQSCFLIFAHQHCDLKMAKHGRNM